MEYSDKTDEKTVKQPSSLGLFPHRPASYKSSLQWIAVGASRKKLSNLVAIAGGWLGIPFGIYGAIFGLIAGVIIGFQGGTDAANQQSVPVIGEFIRSAGYSASGFLGALIQGLYGAYYGFLQGIMYPWQATRTTTVLQIAFSIFQIIIAAVIIATVYTIGSIIFEGKILAFRGARRPSEREIELLQPIVSDCCVRLGLTNAPRVLIRDYNKRGEGVLAEANARHLVISQGLLNLHESKPRAIGAVVSHELAHWHNADAISNLFFRGLCFPLYVTFTLLRWINDRFKSPVIRFIATILLFPVQITVRFIVLPSTAFAIRRAEYQADQAAVLTGYQSDLQELLEGLQKSFDGAHTEWDETIREYHPPAELRLDRLSEAANRRQSRMIDLTDKSAVDFSATSKVGPS